MGKEEYCLISERKKEKSYQKKPPNKQPKNNKETPHMVQRQLLTTSHKRSWCPYSLHATTNLQKHHLHPSHPFPPPLISIFITVHAVI